MRAALMSAVLVTSGVTLAANKSLRRAAQTAR
jgi:hypothetical protein